MMVWWLLVVIGWKHWVMDHDGVGSRPRVMEQVLTMNVIPYNESHKTDLPSASFVRSPNCRDGTFVAECVVVTILPPKNRRQINH